VQNQNSVPFSNLNSQSSSNEAPAQKAPVPSLFKNNNRNIMISTECIQLLLIYLISVVEEELLAG
jgi:hypothetical protein